MLDKMFIYSNHIANVNRYDVAEKLIYLTNDKNEERKIIYDNELISSNVLDFVRNLKGEIVFYTRDLKVYKKVISGLKLLLEGYSIYDEKYDDETIFVFKKISPGNHIKYLYNFINEKFIRDISDVPIIITDFFEMSYLSTVIKKSSRLNNTINWEIDLSGRKYIVRDKEKNATIVKFIGIEDGMLIVFMSNKELISIDIETGKIIWETKDFIKKNLPTYNDYRMVRSIFYYGILENGKLYQLDGNIYYSIDLKTQEVEVLWEDKSEKEYLTCQYASYTEDYVYFTGSRDNRFSPYLLGAFNRKTLQLDWIHEPEGIVNPLTNVPHYVNGKLYILDSGRVLHIYDKE